MIKMKINIFLIITIFFTNSGFGQTAMAGLSIGEDQRWINEVPLEVLVSELEYETPRIKFITDNGNYLSITTQNGKVVYMENNWNQEVTGKESLIPNFIFGETSLKEIYKKFGTRGFIYTKQDALTIGNEKVFLNCFELSEEENVVLVVITKTSIDTKIDDDNSLSKLLLEALILSDSDYLDEYWGDEKSYSESYKKIKSIN